MRKKCPLVGKFGSELCQVIPDQNALLKEMCLHSQKIWKRDSRVKCIFT